MPVKHASIKHLRQTKKRTARNKQITKNLKNAVKTARKILAAGDKTKANETVKKAVKILDKAAQGEYIKKNKASRLKSRLILQLNKLK